MVRLSDWLLILTALVGVSVRAPADMTDAPALRLTLTTDKTTYLVAEPVGIRLRLENLTDEAVTGDFHLTYDLDHVRIQTAKNAEEFLPYVSKALELARQTKTVTDAVTIAPGGTVEAVEFVSFDARKNGLALPEAGAYRLRALLLYEHYKEQRISNIVSLEVVEPAGADREALDSLRANELGHLLTPEASLFPMDDDAIHRLKVFLDSFPTSPYASHARVALDEICRSSVSLDEVPSECPPLDFCVGDCQGDGTVLIGDLVLGVSISLGIVPLDDCRNFDREGDREVTISELVIGVTHALGGCPATALRRTAR